MVHCSQSIYQTIKLNEQCISIQFISCLTKAIATLCKWHDIHAVKVLACTVFNIVNRKVK